MTITIRLKTDNAVFQDGNRDAEIARIVQTIVSDLNDGGPMNIRTNLRDSNGNTVGSVTVKGR